MKNLVSSKVVRILRIFEKTYFCNTACVSEISQINNCSTNTVKADFEYIESHWSDLLEVEYDHSQISIDNIAMGDLMMIKEILLRDEITIELLMNIFFKPQNTIYNHSIELNYSESHLRKTIIKINSFLKVVDSHIEYYKDGTDSRPIIRSNDEIRLCHLIASIYQTAKYENKMPLNEDTEPAVFTNYLLKLNLPITTPMQNYLNILAPITHARYTQGFVSREKVMDKYDEIFEQYKMSDFIEVFNNSLNNELKSYFGAYYIQQHQSDFKVINDVLISLLFKVVVSPPNVDDVFNRYEIFHKRFEIEHQQGYEVFNQTLSNFSQLLGKDFQDHYGEIIYNLYIHLPHLRPNKRFKVGVYSDIALSHAYALSEFMKNHFNGHHIEVFQENKTYDFVISTITNDALLEDQKVVLISDLPGSDDMHKLYGAIYGMPRSWDTEEQTM